MADPEAEGILLLFGPQELVRVGCGGTASGQRARAESHCRQERERGRERARVGGIETGVGSTPASSSSSG